MTSELGLDSASKKATKPTDIKGRQSSDEVHRLNK